MSTIDQSVSFCSKQYYLSLANEALKRFPINEQAIVRLINYSENYTFLVEDRENSFKAILRISSPGYHSKQELDAEIIYLKSIIKNAIIEVPEPIYGIDGEYIQSLKTEQSDTPCYCTMFSFLSGETPDEESKQELTVIFNKLGEVTAKFHHHSQTWHKAQLLERPVWDYETTLGSKPNWGRWQDGVGVTPERNVLFQKVSETIKTRLSKFGTSSNRFGLIHGDLRAANLLVENGQLKVLDFDDFGFGWYLYDLATALSFIEHKDYINDLINAWLTGYKKIRNLSLEEEQEIPTFIMLRRLLLVGWIGSHDDTDLAKRLGETFTEQTVLLAEKYLKHFS